MDFALILFVLSVVTGVLWCYDVFKARKRRKETLQAVFASALDKHKAGDIGIAEAMLVELGIRQADARAALATPETAVAGKGALRLPDPWWVEYGASFFPVILPIFLLRSFWVEPFRIPSNSMVPTLLTGDFILVNKYSYGVRLPVLNKKVIEVGTPQRGDVMVFRYPFDTTQDYIKRVVGVPGDKIEYNNKRLTINGVPIQIQPDGDYVLPDNFEVAKKLQEDLAPGHQHAILNLDTVPAFISPQGVQKYDYSENCTYSASGVTCTVPPGHYFMMGDNRDQSADSRYWGFVPDENIVGKAFFIWFHADHILPPSGVNFGRVGGFH